MATRRLGGERSQELDRYVAAVRAEAVLLRGLVCKDQRSAGESLRLETAADLLGHPGARFPDLFRAGAIDGVFDEWFEVYYLGVIERHGFEVERERVRRHGSRPRPRDS